MQPVEKCGKRWRRSLERLVKKGIGDKKFLKHLDACVSCQNQLHKSFSELVAKIRAVATWFKLS